MRDVWLDLCARNTTRKDSYLRIDAFAWLNKVTLDIIGLAGTSSIAFHTCERMTHCHTGFDYDVDSLHAPEDQPNELNEAVRTIFSFDFGVGALMQFLLPGVRHIVSPSSRVLM